MGWQFWVDRGGTFTDLVGRDPSGQLHVRKVLSVQPELAGDPAVQAIRALLQLQPQQPIPSGRIAALRLGTTVATNALLEQAGDPVLLISNQGLGDLLRIGDQHRPELFALQPQNRPWLAAQVVEVEARLDASGVELQHLSLDGALRQALEQARAAGIGSCAIALMHAYRNPSHELALQQFVAQCGFHTVVCSHQVCPLPRLVPRGQTTLVEAAVARVLFSYLDQVREALGRQVQLQVMGSSGALLAPAELLAKDTILSGPAGGMVGAVAAARQAGFQQQALVGFDMGGTSTDVFCVPAGQTPQDWERSPQTELAGLTLLAPRLPIHTVAAGGGSILSADGGRLRVGPRSAGADPGPACYRRGGPLTLTDAHVLLGRLQVGSFPAVFGPAADQPPDAEVVQQRFAALAQPLACTAEQLAEGALDLAVETMAAAIEQVSLFRGHDIRGGVLIAYGGAGGQLACRLAAALGLHQVLLHPLAGVLSAWGIGQAQPRRWQQRSLREPLTEELLQQLESEVQQQPEATAAQRRLELRDQASEQGLLLPWPRQSDVAGLTEAFAAAHQQRFGYRPPLGTQLVVERMELEWPQLEPPLQALPPPSTSAASAAAEPVRMYCAPQGGWRQVPLLRREQLRSGQRLQGPALIPEATGCTVLEPGWSAVCDGAGNLVLERDAGVVPAVAAPVAAAGVDPVELGLFHHRFMAIAERMGERLRLTSRSVNIRERLDFSCALFDHSGALVANAPHIPVHLGSMGEVVVDLLEQVRTGRRAALQPGDTLLSNDPFHGGTHLPDITAITPVFAGQPQPVAFVACRGHHVDVGGLTPGSMPPFSTTLAAEGLCLHQWLLVRHGELQLEAWQRRLAQEPTPPRAPELLLADLQAQVAANQLGVVQLEALIQQQGLGAVEHYMAQVQCNAAAAVRQVVRGLQDRCFSLELDHGARLALALTVDRQRGSARLDFSASSPQGEHNFNAPLAVTKAAVLYVFRTLVNEPIPLNAGCFEPLELVVPPGCLLNPRAPAAVVAGNVETSQALCNLLYGAMGVMAAAQGTMNNLIFGDAERQYYETVAGGTGAGHGFAGADGVQSHMTNSRLTDPEILEQRFPVRLERFALRRGSGGAGRWPGGDGLERRLRFLAPMTASLLSSSRRVAPFGLAGGSAGACGRNRIKRLGEPWAELPACAVLELQPGDQLELLTPGGGGFGPPL
ncbi:MAG: hydantoinase B/oxoprolinase family protein [Synechococcus sp.]|nr:hydantoinase B/oxoprolinase family protein [Synechococcus sp.]